MFVLATEQNGRIVFHSRSCPWTSPLSSSSVSILLTLGCFLLSFYLLSSAPQISSSSLLSSPLWFSLLSPVCVSISMICYHFFLPSSSSLLSPFLSSPLWCKALSLPPHISSLYISHYIHYSPQSSFITPSLYPSPLPHLPSPPLPSSLSLLSLPLLSVFSLLLLSASLILL